MPNPIELPKFSRATRLTAAQTAEVAPVIAAAYRDGRSLRGIASDTGRSYGWVHRTLTDFGVTLRPRGTFPLPKPADRADDPS